MYSLYRAWFGGEESYPRLETLSPPDTVVRVGNDGEYHFVAHRAVLAAHSGYLKALLASAAAETSASAAGAADGAPPMVTSVTVPSTIGGEAFAPLLNYMYTGRLEVTLDNIYTVLLATHLLHMPGALEQCRAALLRLRAPPVIPVVSTNASSSTPSSSSPAVTTQPAGSVLRPVPNRLLGPAFCWPQTPAASHLYPPRHLDLPHLPALQLPPAISVLPTPIIHKTSLSYGTKERSISPASSSSQVAQQRGDQSPSASPELVVASSASSISQRSDEPVRPISRGPSPSPVSSEREVQPQPQAQQQQLQQQQTARRRRPPQQGVSTSRSRQNSRSSRGSNNERSSSSQSNSIQTPGVVYDVACCDGPVRFHRVLNENYAPSSAQTPAIQPQRPIMPACNGRASSCRESDDACENDENEQTSTQHRSPSLNNNAENSRSGSYTCGYCCHTFKSQHCYQKHARRHLLPTGSENSSSERQLMQQNLQQNQQQPPPRTPPQAPESKKREVRLLDLNVQYYPCKICGSKFPSYYFVHKHRKLCHANVDEPQSRSSSASGSAEERASAKIEQQEVQQQQQQPGTSENAQQPA